MAKSKAPAVADPDVNYPTDSRPSLERDLNNPGTGFSWSPRPGERLPKRTQDVELVPSKGRTTRRRDVARRMR